METTCKQLNRCKCGTLKHETKSLHSKTEFAVQFNNLPYIFFIPIFKSINRGKLYLKSFSRVHTKVYYDIINIIISIKKRTKEQHNSSFSQTQTKAVIQISFQSYFFLNFIYQLYHSTMSFGDQKQYISGRNVTKFIMFTSFKIKFTINRLVK